MSALIIIVAAVILLFLNWRKNTPFMVLGFIGLVLGIFMLLFGFMTTA